MTLSPWLEAALWIGSAGVFLALLFFISAPRRRRFGRGGFSVQHLLMLQSVWEPGKTYVFEQKQKHLEEADDEGGSDGKPARGVSGRLPQPGR